MFLRSNVESLDGTLILSAGHLVNGMTLGLIRIDLARAQVRAILDAVATMPKRLR